MSIVNSLQPGQLEGSLELRLGLLTQQVRFGDLEKRREHINMLADAVNQGAVEKLSTETMVNALHILGWCASDHDLQLARLGQAKVLAERLQKARLQGRILDTIATAKRDVGEHSRALQMYEQARQLKQLASDEVGIQITLQNIGWCLLALGRFEDARLKFEAALQQCLDRYARPSARNQNNQDLQQVVSSITFQLVGLLHATFLVGGTRAGFCELTAATDEALRLAETFKAWGCKNMVDEATILLRIGREDYVQSPNMAATGKIALLWSIVSKILKEGKPALPELRGTVLSNELKIDWMRLSELAACHHVAKCNLSEPEAYAPIRDELLTRMRCDEGFVALTDPTLPPWNTSHILSRSLNTAEWPTIGPLETQIAAMTRAGVTPEIAHSEQYLQLLGWTSSLLIAMDANVDYQEIMRKIHNKVVQGNSYFQLNARNSFTLATRLAQEYCQRCQSDWGRVLCKSWKEIEAFIKDRWSSFDALIVERNKGVHHTVYTDRKTQEVLDRHGEVIRYFGTAFKSIDWPKIEMFPNPITSDDKLRGANMISRGRSYNCGPLLMVSPKDSNPIKTLYLPHTLDSKTILQNQPTGDGHACGYKAHVPSDPTDEHLTVRFV